MEYGLGCESRCNTCLRWRIEGYKEIQIDRAITIADINAITESTIMFIDNDFLSSREKFLGFLNIIKELDLKELHNLRLSKRSNRNPGFTKGICKTGTECNPHSCETFKDEELMNYNKKITADEKFWEASIILKELNIDVWASFMAHPDWNKADLKALEPILRK